EIVALDTAGRPSFSLLQRRMHTPRPGRRLLTDVPAAFYLFDVLELDGSDVGPLPYLERRELLDTSLTSTGAVQVTP
ncbi:ATP-dependent DNA ligase, partial [Gordonia terrae]|nr:ATP-dependent DNA ligase [Gordonia terrae]